MLSYISSLIKSLIDSFNETITLKLVYENQIQRHGPKLIVFDCWSTEDVPVFQDGYFKLLSKEDEHSIKKYMRMPTLSSI